VKERGSASENCEPPRWRCSRSRCAARGGSGERPSTTGRSSGVSLRSTETSPVVSGSIRGPRSSNRPAMAGDACVIGPVAGHPAPLPSRTCAAPTRTSPDRATPTREDLTRTRPPRGTPPTETPNWTPPPGEPDGPDQPCRSRPDSPANRSVGPRRRDGVVVSCTDSAVSPVVGTRSPPPPEGFGRAGS